MKRLVGSNPKNITILLYHYHKTKQESPTSSFHAIHFFSKAKTTSASHSRCYAVVHLHGYYSVMPLLVHILMALHFLQCICVHTYINGYMHIYIYIPVST